MRNINKVILSGNLTREPELRRTASGTAVLSIGIASNDSRRNAAGGWEDYANYIDCTMWGERAEKLASMLHKGSKVCIEGRLRYSSWEREGQRRSKIDVTIENIELMNKKEEQTYEPDDLFYDDVPF